MHEEYPKMMKDQYWNEIFPSELPYTEATKHLQTAPFLGSAQAIEARSLYISKKSTVGSADEQKVPIQLMPMLSDKHRILLEYLYLCTNNL